MALGLYERRARARRRVWWGVFKWTMGIGAVLAAGTYSYLSGSTLAERDVAAQRQEIAELADKVAQLQQANAEHQKEMASSRQRLAELQKRYKQDVPSGEMKDLFELAQRKLEVGVDPSRLAFLIGAAENKDSCENDPVTRRFIVRTPLYSGANDAVGFADGAITITARGQSAVDAKGNAEARFDPAKPIEVTFAVLGGKISKAAGVLPLHHSVVLSDTEYRFSVLAGEPGFVQVTGDSCRYP